MISDLILSVTNGSEFARALFELIGVCSSAIVTNVILKDDQDSLVVREASTGSHEAACKSLPKFSGE